MDFPSGDGFALCPIHVTVPVHFAERSVGPERLEPGCVGRAPRWSIEAATTSLVFESEGVHLEGMRLPGRGPQIPVPSLRPKGEAVLLVDLEPMWLAEARTHADPLRDE